MFKHAVHVYGKLRLDYLFSSVYRACVFDMPRSNTF
jgi:hypothetical protein